MKKALVLTHKEIQGSQFKAFPVLWVHDEYELIVHKDHASQVAALIPKSIIAAGEHFKLKVPMDGTGKIGNNWFEVH